MADHRFPQLGLRRLQPLNMLRSLLVDGTDVSEPSYYEKEAVMSNACI